LITDYTSKELDARIKEITAKVEALSLNVDRQMPVVPPADARLVEVVVENGINRMHEIVSQQPKSIVHG
jgi:hypothetical protein